MLVLQDVLDALASSELVNLSVVQDGEVVEEKLFQVVNAIHLGLIKLYTRFKLKRGFLLLNVTTNHNVYELISDNATSVDSSGYILDWDNPYQDDLLEIIEITDPMNDTLRFDGSAGITLLKPNMLKFKYINHTGTYIIEYVALPTNLIKGTFLNDGSINYAARLELPEAYLNALLCFVAARFYSPVGVAMDSNRNSMDMNYLQRFEQECQLLEAKGIDVDSNQDSDVFMQRGFI